VLEILKAKLKREKSEVVSVATQLKIIAPDGKSRQTDMLDYAGIIALGKQFPSKSANRFIEWFTYSDKTIDGKSKQKAYRLFESSF
jgi:cell filamentation protein